MTSISAEAGAPAAASITATEVPDELPRSIVRLFWLFARPHRATVLSMMIAALSLRALSVMQFYAMKRIIDTAVAANLRAPGVWAVLRPPLLAFFAVVGVFIAVEWQPGTAPTPAAFRSWPGRASWCSRTRSGTARRTSTAGLGSLQRKPHLPRRSRLASLDSAHVPVVGAGRLPVAGRAARARRRC